MGLRTASLESLASLGSQASLDGGTASFASAGSLAVPAPAVPPQAAVAVVAFQVVAPATPPAPASRAVPARTQSARPASVGGGAGAPGGVWACIRSHESGGNYADDTGNGYYGAYQFSERTWLSVGGTGYPNQAAPSVQDAMAQRLQRRSGWGQWSTSSRCGV